MKQWDVKILSEAKEQMREIKDRRIREKLMFALRRLEYVPDQQGKQLAEELVEFHSVRAASQRYRIIYYLREDVSIVFVLSIGIRKEGDKKDVYAQTKKFLRRGLFNLNIEMENIINTRDEKPPLSAIPIEPATSSEVHSLLDTESSPTSSQDLTKLEDA